MFTRDQLVCSGKLSVVRISDNNVATLEGGLPGAVSGLIGVDAGFPSGTEGFFGGAGLLGKCWFAGFPIGFGGVGFPAGCFGEILGVADAGFEGLD